MKQLCCVSSGLREEGTPHPNHLLPHGRHDSHTPHLPPRGCHPLTPIETQQPESVTSAAPACPKKGFTSKNVSTEPHTDPLPSCPRAQPACHHCCHLLSPPCTPTALRYSCAAHLPQSTSPRSASLNSLPQTHVYNSVSPNPPSQISLNSPPQICLHKTTPPNAAPPNPPPHACHPKSTPPNPSPQIQFSKCRIPNPPPQTCLLKFTSSNPPSQLLLSKPTSLNLPPHFCLHTSTPPNPPPQIHLLYTRLPKTLYLNPPPQLPFSNPAPPRRNEPNRRSRAAMPNSHPIVFFGKESRMARAASGAALGREGPSAAVGIRSAEICLAGGEGEESRTSPLPVYFMPVKA